jgi:hypothetical protein
VTDHPPDDPPDDPNHAPGGSGDGPDAEARSEAGRVRRPSPGTSRVDPEDWASTPPDDDERYQRERPPHWE